MQEVPSLYDQRLSKAITWLRFPLIFFIILLHSYSVVRLEGPHENYFKTIYPLALWLGESGVPGFFFISGFLFFSSKKSYLEKLRTRFHSLFVPYILWNLLLLSVCISASFIGLSVEINDKSLSDYSIIDYIRLFWDRGSYDNGNFVPLLCPLWYIRNLLIMSVLSPLFYYIIRYLRESFLIITVMWWMSIHDNAFIPQTILFFSLGAYFPIFNINPLKMVTERKPLFISLFFIFLLADWGSHMILYTPINLQLHRMALLFNIPILLLIGDWCMQRGFYNRRLSDTSFIVFCVHYPIVVVIRKWCISSLNDVTDLEHVFLYLTCIVIATVLSLSVYRMLETCPPQVKNILSGNR